MKNELASVIIPSYNRSQIIRKTLESVWNQTYRPVEVVIVDDGSTDNTREIVNRWKEEFVSEDFKVNYFFQKNSGVQHARNKGISLAKGRFLQFLDSDDLLLPEKLDLQISKMKEEKTGISICDYYVTDERENILSFASNDRDLKHILTSPRFMQTSIAVIDKELVPRKYLKWNPRIRRAQDIDFIFKILLIADRFSYVNKPLFYWVHHTTDNRISKTVRFSALDYTKSLLSLIKFQIANKKSIPKYKQEYLKTLYKKALIAIYSASAFPKLIPDKLKVWKYF